MYTGTLTEVTDPFINAFVNENYNFMIKYLEDRMYLNESDDSESNDERPQNKIDQFLTWLKKNAWQKPRAWFAKVLTKLNNFAAKIAHREATRPGERSIWSKIKEKVARAILWVSNKLENWVRPDKIGIVRNRNATSMNMDDINSEIDKSKENINSVDDNKKKRAHIITSYAFDATVGDGNKDKIEKFERFAKHAKEIEQRKEEKQNLDNAFKKLDQLIQQS